MGKAIGGYVRRCERVQGEIVHLRQRGDGWPLPFEMSAYASPSVPILSFLPFDVKSEDVIKPIDGDAMAVVRSFYEQHPK